MIDKPENMNQIWAENGDVVDPGAAVIDAGWPTLDPVTGDPAPPPHTYMNFIQNKMTKFLAHVNVYGIAVWDATTTYTTESWARSPVNNKVYVSTIDNNIGNEPSVSLSQWSIFDISANIGDTLESYETPEIMESRGYLAMNGQAVSRTTYAELFALIGTQFGPGDGSTTFNLPSSSGAPIDPVLISTVTSRASFAEWFFPAAEAKGSQFYNGSGFVSGAVKNSSSTNYEFRLCSVPLGTTNLTPEGGGSLSYIGDSIAGTDGGGVDGAVYGVFYLQSTGKYYAIASGWSNDSANNTKSGIYSLSGNASSSVEWTKDSSLPELIQNPGSPSGSKTATNCCIIEPQAGTSAAWTLINSTVYKYNVGTSTFTPTNVTTIPVNTVSMVTFYNYQPTADSPDFIFISNSGEELLKSNGATGAVEQVLTIDTSVFGVAFPNSVFTDEYYVFWVAQKEGGNQIFVRADQNFDLTILLERDNPPSDGGIPPSFAFDGNFYIADSSNSPGSGGATLTTTEYRKYVPPVLGNAKWIKAL